MIVTQAKLIIIQAKYFLHYLIIIIVYFYGFNVYFMILIA